MIPAFHVGTRAGGIGQRVGAAGVDLQPAFNDPVEKQRRMGVQQVRCKNHIVDLDALRDAGGLDRAGALSLSARWGEKGTGIRWVLPYG